MKTVFSETFRLLMVAGDGPPATGSALHFGCGSVFYVGMIENEAVAAMKIWYASLSQTQSKNPDARLSKGSHE